MIDKLDREALFPALIQFVKELTEPEVAKLRAMIEALPKPERGERGEPGPQGRDGDAGVEGKPGPQGERGIDGKDGRDGRDGKDGAPGRDAIDIDILPDLEAAQRYSVGTWAYHNGGLVRTAVGGFQTVCEGIAGLSFIQGEDPSEITIRATLTSGREIANSLRVPVLTYRDIYSAKNEYKRGHVVTWDGSLWHCQVESTRAVPGKSEDWKLIVKRGRDGKDGAVGPQGPQGEKGKDFSGWDRA